MSGSVLPHYPVFLRCQQGQFYIFVVEDAYFVKTVLYRKNYLNVQIHLSFSMCIFYF